MSFLKDPVFVTILSIGLGEIHLSLSCIAVTLSIIYLTRKITNMNKGKDKDDDKHYPTRRV